MKKVIKTLILFSSPFLFVNCGGGDSPEVVNEPPAKVDLIYPSQDLLCIDNRIEFDWNDAIDPDEKDIVKYRFVVAKNRSLTDIVRSQTTVKSNLTVNLEKGTPYYWKVTAFDNNANEGEASSVFAFYTKGTGEANNAPFTAELVSPGAEARLDASTVSVDLKWTGADSNTGDTLSYEVFFAEDADLTDVSSSQDEELYNVTVATGKTYYWKVNTIDNSGAKSIGQVWSFSVN